MLSAYAFAFLKFRAEACCSACSSSTLLVPLEATLVANRRTVDSLGWLNTYQGLAAPFLATAFGTFLLRQVFLQLPKDLREAAVMDGLGHFGFLREVAVPLVRPTLGALGLFSFLSSWNQYLWPSLVTTENDMNTVQTGLKLLQVVRPRPAEPGVGRHGHRRGADLPGADGVPAPTRAGPHRRSGEGMNRRPRCGAAARC